MFSAIVHLGFSRSRSAPEYCPLTSMCGLWVSTFTHTTHIIVINSKIFRKIIDVSGRKILLSQIKTQEIRGVVFVVVAFCFSLR